MIYRTLRHRYGRGIGPIVISWSTLRCACNLLVDCSHYLCILRDACETEMASCCWSQLSQSSTGDLGSASHFHTHPWGSRNFKIVSWVSRGYDMNLGFKWRCCHTQVHPPNIPTPRLWHPFGAWRNDLRTFGLCLRAEGTWLRLFLSSGLFKHMWSSHWPLNRPSLIPCNLSSGMEYSLARY